MDSKPEDIPASVKNTIEKKTNFLATKIVGNVGKRGMNGRGKRWFYIIRFAHKHFVPSEPEFSYCEKLA